MIYFLVNNGYQYFDVLANKGNTNESTLIVVPHKIDNWDATHFVRVHVFETPFISRKWWTIRPVRQLSRKIMFEINPGADDILFFYTEYEPMNQFIAARFKDAGARVYMIEDGGVASYIPNRCVVSDTLSLPERLRQFWTRQALQLPQFTLFKLGGEPFPRMGDASIDGIFYYRPVPVRRAFPRILIKRETEEIRGDVQSVLFLNQPLYQGYDQAESYLQGLALLMAGLSSRYQHIYFKFHPRDSAAWKERIRPVINSAAANVIFIEKNDPIEFIIKNYMPGFVASYFTAALMSLLEMGVEPIFLYRLACLPKTPPIVVLDEILEELGYNFPTSFSDLGPAYSSGLKSTYSDKTLSAWREEIEQDSRGKETAMSPEA